MTSCSSKRLAWRAVRDAFRNTTASFPAEGRADATHHAPIRLLDLPNEIVLAIVQVLDWHTIKSIRLTCSAISRLLNPALLHESHICCAKTTWNAELALVRSGGPDSSESRQHSGWCILKSLPCYRCLHWRISNQNLPEWTYMNGFTRGQTAGHHNVAGIEARHRRCIPCGLRIGRYTPGASIWFAVLCVRCGELCNKPGNWSGVEILAVNDFNWLSGRYCGRCLDQLAAQSQELRSEFIRAVHDKYWYKYEEGMRKGKLYRLQKGRESRKSRGVVDQELDDQNDEQVAAQGMKKRWCQLVGEKRLCDCEHRKRRIEFNPMFRPGLHSSKLIASSAELKAL